MDFIKKNKISIFNKDTSLVEHPTPYKFVSSILVRNICSGEFVHRYNS